MRRRFLPLTILALPACGDDIGADGTTGATGTGAAASTSPSSGTTADLTLTGTGGETDAEVESLCLEVVRGSGEGRCFEVDVAPLNVFALLHTEDTMHLLTSSTAALLFHPYAPGGPWDSAFETPTGYDQPVFAALKAPPRIAIAERHEPAPRDGDLWSIGPTEATAIASFEIGMDGAGSWGDLALSADFTADGLDDLVYLSEGTEQFQVFVTGNDGSLSARPVADLGVQVWPQRATAGDFDGDGHVDITCPSMMGRAVLWGQSTGAFVDPTILRGLSGESTAADVDGDGLDEIVTTLSGLVRVTELDGRAEVVHEEPVEGWAEFAASFVEGIALGDGTVGVLGIQLEKDAEDREWLHFYVFSDWNGTAFGRIEAQTIDVKECPGLLGGPRLLPAMDLDGDDVEDAAVAVSHGCDEYRTYLLLTR